MDILLQNFLKKNNIKKVNITLHFRKQSSKNLKLQKEKKLEQQINQNEIDKIEKELPPLTEFILPCGHTIFSLCQITRTICRRAERRVVQLQSEQEISATCLEYLNRLSDYLFVLARLILQEKKGSEISWIKF